MPIHPFPIRLLPRVGVAALVASIASFGATEASADEATNTSATYRPHGPPRAALGFAGAAIFAAGYGATVTLANDEGDRFFSTDDSRRALYVPVVGPALYWVTADYRGDFAAYSAVFDGMMAAALTAVQVGGAALCLVAVADSERSAKRAGATKRLDLSGAAGPTGASLRLTF